MEISQPEIRSEVGPQSVAYYFDPISPYAYLAAARLPEIQQHTNAVIIAKPVLFGGLLKALEHKGPVEIPSKREYTFRDVMRQADSLSLTLTGPPAHPFNPLAALRVCIAIDDPAKRLEFSLALLDSAWADGRDIVSIDAVCLIAKVCGIDPDWARAAAQDSEIKRKLVSATESALEKGIFGVPTFCVGSELFWGADRIDDLIRYLEGHRIDETALEQILARKSGIVRR